MNGFIKWHRRLLTNPIFRRDRTAWHIFEVLVLSADWQTGAWEGGRFMLAELCNEKPPTTYAALKRLEKAEMITLESNNRFTRIHICKWNEYQTSDNTSEQQPDNNQITTGQQPDSTIYKENKNIRNKEVKKKTTNVVATYGSPEINQAFQDWQEATGIAITSNVTRNRRAASNLLKKHGAANVGKLLKLVGAAQLDQYAPRIADFCQLQAKTTELLVWAKTQGVTQQKNQIVSV